jgi:hypothetical protein
MLVTGPLAEMINNKNPGPGAYEAQPKKNSVAFSLRSKTVDPKPESERIPGPGSCIIFSNKDEQKNCFNQSGENFNSKFKNQKANKFSSANYRFKYEENLIPGPGKYNTSSI